jgi:hypothetical protein
VLEQRVGEREVAEVIGAELQLEALGGAGQRRLAPALKGGLSSAVGLARSGRGASVVPVASALPLPPDGRCLSARGRRC